MKAIATIRRLFPAMKQVACFDTAFHRHMPEVAQRIPMPRSLWNEGVLRYGFHGLSYEYIISNLREIAGQQAANGRVLIAHLGNGASMAAVREGRGIDTTMGLTPAGGLMMGTRSGDLDPGIIVYLLQEKGRSPSTIDYLVNQRSGLIGVSGSSSDMRICSAARPPIPTPPRPSRCSAIRREVRRRNGDHPWRPRHLIFTAGVGTNAPKIRQRICTGLKFMGIHIDAARNQANAAVISTDQSP